MTFKAPEILTPDPVWVAEHVREGFCYGPVAKYQDPLDDNNYVVTCFWGICDWTDDKISNKSLGDHQNSHNEAGTLR